MVVKFVVTTKGRRPTPVPSLNAQAALAEALFIGAVADRSNRPMHHRPFAGRLSAREQRERAVRRACYTRAEVVGLVTPENPAESKLRWRKVAE